LNSTTYALLLLKVLDLVVPHLLRSSTKATEFRDMVMSGREPTLDEWHALFAELAHEDERLDVAIARLELGITTPPDPE
jgi:hypothetical protein